MEVKWKEKVQLQTLRKQEGETIKIIKWLLSGINYFLVGAICRLFRESSRAVKTVIHFICLMGVFAVFIFPFLLFKLTWLFIGLAALHFTVIAWEQYYSRIPKKVKQEEPNDTAEARADPMAF